MSSNYPTPPPDAPLGGPAQPPPPATGTLARTLADAEIYDHLIRMAWECEDRAGLEDHASPETAEMYRGRAKALRIMAATKQQPAPVAADGTGHSEQMWAALGIGPGDRRAFHAIRGTKESADTDARKLRDLGAEDATVSVVPVRVSVLADDAAMDLAAIDKGSDLGPRPNEPEFTAAPHGPVGEAGRVDDAGADGAGTSEREKRDEFVRRTTGERMHESLCRLRTALDDFRSRLAAAEARADKLQAFKLYVHLYLDAHGVPHHPPGPHGAEGCRIGDRMDWLMAKLAGAEGEARRLRDAIKRAGFAVMQTSGAWDIYDVSDQGKAADAKSLAVATENVELSVENRRLRAALEWYADEMNYQWAGATGRVPAAADNGERARAALAAPAGGAAGRDGGGTEQE